MKVWRRFENCMFSIEKIRKKVDNYTLVHYTVSSDCLLNASNQVLIIQVSVIQKIIKVCHKIASQRVLIIGTVHSGRSLVRTALVPSTNQMLASVWRFASLSLSPYSE